MAQSKLHSLKEAAVNTGIGFLMSLVLQIFLAWAYGTQLTLFQNIQITIYFTILSIIRSYVVRRWFNKGVKPIIINGLNAVAARHWMWIEKMGWHKSTTLERLALIGSEVGEAVNECRGWKPSDKFGSELADIILRTIDLAHDKGIDIEAELAAKMATNEAKGNYKGRTI